LILRHVSKCVFSCPECPKIDGGWSFVTDPTGGAYSAPPDTLAVFRGRPPRKRDGERGGNGGEEGKGRGRRDGRLVPWAQEGIDTPADTFTKTLGNNDTSHDTSL